MKTIKHTTLALLLFLSFSVSAQPTEEYDFLKGSTLMSMKGTGYVYEVDFRGTQYDFIVTLKENSAEKGMEFDYKMTNSSNTSGTVKMSAAAKQSGRAQNNYFSGGEMNLTDMTTVWMSKDVMDELENKGESKISTDGGESWVVLKRKHFNYDFAVKTKSGMRNDISYMYCESDDGSAKYWIQTGGNPLILKMDLGWSITLKQFKMSGEK